ncbi:MAG: VWA domain-containing protein [Microbacteriaceae bacterium]|nr:VWA domain-containing protein [Microbacteriaceae bacterium]
MNALMLKQQRFLFIGIIALAVLFIIIGRNVASFLPTTTGTTTGVSAPSNDCVAANAIEISLIYAPEMESFLVPAIEQFNCTFAKGTNPLTGAKIADGEQPIHVTGRVGSSGTVHQGIINALIAPNNANVEQPTIFAPSVSHWPALVNYQVGREIFTLDECRPTALAPVVIAIWESRLAALQKANGGQPVGWEDLLAVLKAPNGWADYGFTGRQTVYYGHTNPYISSTGLSTLIAEFYASARYQAGQADLRRLTPELVQDPKVQAGVREIEEMIKHYSERTTEFKEYIAQGPDYVDFVALEENDLIYINQGKTEYKPPEKLVALYPKEGTFWHEHPFCVPNTDWVSAEQRSAATQFTDFIRSTEIQKTVMAAGFRPVDLSLKLADPFIKELGVDPLQPTTTIDVPSTEAIAAIQTSWQYVKKQADIALVIDVSGSMEGDKLEQARRAAQRFLDLLPPQNRVTLITFNDVIMQQNELAPFEQVEGQVRGQIDGMVAAGGTALYDAVAAAADFLDQGEGNRIRAIVVLSDGQDTGSMTSLNDLTRLDRGEQNPLLIFPVAYGDDADISSLNTIARTSSTKVISGDESGIRQLFELLSSYF